MRIRTVSTPTRTSPNDAVPYFVEEVVSNAAQHRDPGLFLDRHLLRGL
jgi:hypothetical protein